ncbi:hypothetical protein [Burkholderia pseudomallei]|uniref:hypothetical protein n=1 Tax=Burkholderia pseudomallei TaxID=28450 RepID=UPI000055B70C|nr:hypothetical protein [Burkholderia pseudomallei]AJX60050.1 hypothetical protein DP47_3436 [Burkholderia pseudomallei Pasteur 52237]
MMTNIDSRPADALTEAATHTIATIKRQLDLIAERAPGDFLDKRPVVQSLGAHVRRLEKALAASPVEQSAQMTAQAALAAIETFEIVGENNDSREPNDDDRFILNEFIAHLFGGYSIEQLASAPPGAEPPRHIVDAAMDVARHEYGHGVTRSSIVAIWKALGKPWIEPPPESVLAALDRMCTPLHESRLSGVTAAADAHCMELIRDYVLKAAPAPFMKRVQSWMLECFGAEISADVLERNHRFFEEAGELVQACGMTREEAHALVDYTWSRPAGEPTQEVGGVMVTLAAHCLANGIDMHAAGETELARINVPETITKIRAKQAAKPKHSPLPIAVPTADGRPYEWRDTGALETGDAQ